MKACRFHRRIDSDTLQISGLAALAGKDVEVIILVEAARVASRRDRRATT